MCASEALVDGGSGTRFPVATPWMRPGQRMTGFVIRFDGQVYGYLNECRHVPTELDWQEGEFFDHSGLYLICATHGAAYEPESGHCVAGPCRGARLTVLQVAEQGGMIYWFPDEKIHAPTPEQGE